MQGIGYKEIILYLEGKMNLSEAIDLIKKDTRHYAKRQITWFKRDAEANMLYPDESESFEKLLAQAVEIINKRL